MNPRFIFVTTQAHGVSQHATVVSNLQDKPCTTSPLLVVSVLIMLSFALAFKLTRHRRDKVV